MEHSKAVVFVVTGALLTGCGETPETGPLEQMSEPLLDAGRVLGFENAADWTVSAGSVSSSSERVEGSASLAIRNFTYTELRSAPLSSLGAVGSRLAVELRAPLALGWGQAQLFVNVPSRGVHNAYVGQVALAGTPGDTWRTLVFTLPPNVAGALGQSYTDLTFKLALGVPQSTLDYRVDHLRFQPGETMDEACSPSIVYEGSHPAGDGAFRSAIAPLTPAQLMVGITRQVCRILYPVPAEVTSRPNPLVVRVSDFDGFGFADDLDHDGRFDMIAMSGRYLASLPSNEVLAAARGILSHEGAHIYQHNGGGVPGGVFEGLADYVRFTAGYDSLSRRAAGGTWDAGYTTTGFFLSWLEGQYPGFVQELNRRIGQPWSTQVFVELTGSDVDTLWAEYQAAIQPPG